ncbi:MAG: hypothetical protein CXX72_03960 [Methanobacteriota archaeon]|nr:MAG: hypothetical protein CXX72_03960 [Euryarchaeota archaeon]
MVLLAGALLELLRACPVLPGSHIVSRMSGDWAVLAGTTQREQFSFKGSSTTLRSRPYFRLGMTIHRVKHSMKMAHTLWLIQR